MAFRVGDRVKESTTTTGTGTYDLAGPATSFQSFVSGVGDANTTCYLATDGTDWEVGIGTVTDAGTDTLSRDLLLDSSTGAAISWTSGSKDIACVAGAGIYGSRAKAVDSITADPSPALEQNGTMYLCNTSGGAFTVTLPAVADMPNGYSLTFFKTDTSTNAITIDGNASEVINDATTYKLDNQYDSITIVNAAGEWRVSDSNYSKLGGARNYREHFVDHGSQGANYDIDFTLAPVQKVTLTASIDLRFINAPPDGVIGSVLLIIDKTGAYTPTITSETASFESHYPFATLPTWTDSQIDIITVITHDNGFRLLISPSMFDMRLGV